MNLIAYRKWRKASPGDRKHSCQICNWEGKSKQLFATPSDMEGFRLAHIVVMRASGVYYRAELWVQGQDNSREHGTESTGGTDSRDPPIPPRAPIPPEALVGVLPRPSPVPSSHGGIQSTDEEHEQDENADDAIVQVPEPQQAGGGSRRLAVHHPRPSEDDEQ